MIAGSYLHNAYHQRWDDGKESRLLMGGLPTCLHEVYGMEVVLFVVVVFVVFPDSRELGVMGGDGCSLRVWERSGLEPTSRFDGVRSRGGLSTDFSSNNVLTEATTPGGASAAFGGGGGGVRLEVVLIQDVSCFLLA